MNRSIIYLFLLCGLQLSLKAQVSVAFKDLRGETAALPLQNNKLTVTAFKPDSINSYKLFQKGNPGNPFTPSANAAREEATYTFTNLAGTGPFELVFQNTTDNSKTFEFKVDIENTGVQTVATGTAQPDFRTYVKDKYGLQLQTGRIKLNRKLNQAKEGNIIHVFIDENGMLYYSGFPTTAREDNLFKIHLFCRKGTKDRFRLEYEGVYDPKWEVYGTDQNETIATSAGNEVDEVEFPLLGPFTSSLLIKLFKDDTAFVNKTINIAKVHHVSINAGLYSSFLKNPSNIAIFEKPNGDTTLVADDPTSRGFVSVAVSFYPWPRNLLYPSGNWKERCSFIIGTSISKDLAENFFGGVSFDISRGLSIALGAHYGRRQYVVEHSDFDFGNDKFSGSLVTRNKWDIGFFTGLNFDMRLLGYIFNLTPAATPPLK